MGKCALLTVLGFTAILVSVAAGEATSFGPTITFEELSLYRPELLTMVDSSALLRDLTMPNIVGEQFLPVPIQFGWVEIQAADIFPVVYVNRDKAPKTSSSRLASKDGKDAKDSTGEVMSSPLNPYYYGGEMGAFYGHSSGKFGRDDFGSYITGTVGSDKLQISVGASYEESSGRFPRWAR